MSARKHHSGSGTTGTDEGVEGPAKAALHSAPVVHRWQVCRTVYAPPPERIVDPGIAHHCLSLHLANSGNCEQPLERCLDGESPICRPTAPGLFTFVPAYRSPQWFWEAKVEVLEVMIPAFVLEQTAVAQGNVQSVELIDRFAIRDPLLEQLALSLYSETLQGEGDRFYQESLQTMLVAHLIRHHCVTPVINVPRLGKMSHSALNQIFDYIQDHLDRDIHLSDLAGLVEMSPDHFGKRFKQSVGVSPHQYVLQCRIDRARQLLRNSRLTLAEIAQAAGFFDQSHFTNVFRRCTQATPQQFRNQHS